jgi:hypothetical protein
MIMWDNDEHGYYRRSRTLSFWGGFYNGMSPQAWGSFHCGQYEDVGNDWYRVGRDMYAAENRYKDRSDR